MTTALHDSATGVRPPADHIFLENVSWELYELLLRDTGQQHLRITYDCGRMELMSPLPKHERVKKMVGLMVALIAIERGIPMRQLGSTTFRRRKRLRGLEPDECFYVQSEAKIRDKDELDLEVDPPPDLAIEVDVTNWSVDRLPIYAALGVKEIWRYDGLRLNCLCLTSDGKYQNQEMSLAFPFLRVAEVTRFLQMWPATEETATLRAFRDWVRNNA